MPVVGSYQRKMATFCIRLVRTALTGLHLAPGRLLPPQLSQTQTVCQRLQPHVFPAASLCSSRAEPQESTRRHSSAKAEQEEPEEAEGPEYIPRRKAKNPMIKIGYAWMIGLPTGIIGFILAKRQVDKNRLKQMKIRQRMKLSNEGDYGGSRYRHHAREPKLDQ